MGLFVILFTIVASGSKSLQHLKKFKHCKKRPKIKVTGVADQTDIDRNWQADTRQSLECVTRGSYCAMSPSDDVCLCVKPLPNVVYKSNGSTKPGHFTLGESLKQDISERTSRGPLF